MDGSTEVITVWIPLAVGLCSLIGICITIYLLVWRIPNKADMHRRNSNRHQQINHGFESILVATKEIREDMRLMRLEILTVIEKIESISQEMRTGMDTLTNKIDSSSQAIHEKN